MTAKVPVRATFTGSDVTGLAEYQSGEFVPLTHGGLGASLSIGSAGQVLKVNGAGNAIEFGAVEAIINIDGATDLTSATLQASDQIMLSDGGTEGRVTLSQLDTLFKDTTQTLTNKTINSDSNTITLDLSEGTLTGTTAEFNSALSDGSFATLAGTETLTNKTIINPTITGGTFSGTFTGTMDATGMVLSGASPLVFEGATDDANETTLAFVDPTTDRTITFPNATGTIVLEATGSTLTNKSIDLGNNTISGSLAEFNTALQDDSFVGLAATQTLTNKTLTSAVLNTGVSGSAILDEDDLSSNSATQLATQQSIKAYVDAVNTSFTLAADSGSNDTFTSGNTLTFVGGTGVDTTVSDNQISIAIDSTVTTLTGTQTLTNKTLTSPTITGTGAIAGTFTGNITGDVTGNADTATALATARTIGGVSFDGSANINLPGVNTSGNQDTSGNAATATTLETARTIAGQSFDGSANITIASTDLSNTSNITLNDATQTLTNKTLTSPVIAEIDATGDFTLDAAGDIILNADGGDWMFRDGSTEILKVFNSSSDVNIKAQVQDKDILFRGNDGGSDVIALTLDMSDAGAATFNSNVTVGGNAVITGDLTVNGTTTTLATTNSTISDRLIELGNGTTGTPGNDMGIVLERGDSDNAFIGWDESADKFIVGTGTFTGASTGNLTITTGTLVANLEGNVTGDLTGDVTGNVTGDVTGNADTATALETARTIAGQSFDGTGNITIASTDLSNTSAIALLTSTQTLTNKTIDLGDNTLTGTTAEFNSALQDDSFATLAGTETLTNKTLTSPTIDTINSTTFTVDATVINLDASDNQIYLKDNGNEFGRFVNDGGNLQIKSSSSGTTALTFSGADITAAGTITGTFSGNITGDVTGNADTATTLATARTIAGQSFDGSANITIASTDLSNTSNITLLDGTQTLTNKTLTSPTINTATISLGADLTMGSNNIVFEGATADAFETTLTVVDPTADRTITFQNASGTVAFLSDVTGGSTPGNFTTITLDNNITFEGATADDFETTLTVEDPTADRTVTIPNATGQIVLRDTTDTLTNKTINASNNTLSNIGNSSLTNSSITFSDGSNSTAASLGGTVTIQGTSNEITVAESSGTFTISQPDDVTIGRDLAVTRNAVITGNLTVNGTTTTLATTNSVISDRLIELGNGTTGTPGNDMGIVLERGDSDNAFIGWDESADKFIVGTGTFTGASTGNLTITTGTLVANLEGNVTGDLTGDVTGDVTGNVTGDVTGNADTATTLATARNIGGVSFDGSANINLPGVNTSGNQDTSGNAATATALETARTIAGQSFDGTGNITIASTDLSNTSAIALLTSTQTLTNKTIDLGSNTLTGSLAEFNTALQGDSFVSLTGSETLTNKTLTSPVLNTATVGTTLSHADNVKALYGTGNDLEIYHDGTQSIITDVGTGQLKILAENTLYFGSATGTEKYIRAVKNGTVELSYDNSPKLVTSSTGVTITGTAVATAFTGDLTGDVTGNASTATTLETARTIAGQSFDGSANITIASTDLSNTSNITLNDATQTLTNKTLTSPTITGTGAIAGTFTGNITGDVTGNADTATTLATARTIAGQSFDGSANITIAATDLSDTDQSLSTTDNVTFNNLVVSGDLTVSGTTTTVNTETINLADNTITLNSNATGSATENGGIEIERGDDTNKTLLWNETSDKWTVGSETFVAGTFEGALTGNVTGDVTGNADTATALATARTIGGVSFDGTANIDLPGVNTSGNQDTSGNAATATILANARTIAGQSFNGSANITIASTDLSDTASIATLTGSQTLTNKSIDSDNNTITNIVNADIKSSAAIAFSKMADLTASRALASDSNGDVSVTSVTATELGYLDGVSSAIQTQLDAKQATIDSSNRLNANLVGDGSVDNTEFGYLNGVTSAVQTQLDNKATKGFAIAMAIAL